MARKKTSRSKSKKRVKIVKHAKGITQILKAKRNVNLANVGGLLVDGAYISKTNNNILFTTTTGSGSVNYGSLSLKARLYDVYDYTEYTVLWDRYKIDKIVVRLTPYATVASSGAAIASTQAQCALLCHSIIDYDDSDLPAASEAGVVLMREYKNYKCKNLLSRMGKPLIYTFVPRVSADVYAGGIANGTSAKSEAFGWMDCQETQVEGYSLKMIFETIAPGGTYNVFFKMDAVYYMSFKDPR